MLGNRKIKVLQVGKFYPPYRGGMETHLQTLCQGLRDDVDLEVVVSNTGPATVHEAVDGIEVTRIGRSATFASASINPRLASAIAASDADIVHLHWPNPTAVAAYLWSRHRGGLVMTYHSDVVRQRVLGAMFSPVLEAALRRCRTIVAASPNYVESSPALRRHAGRCRVIPFGIDRYWFEKPDAAAVEAVKKRWGGPLILSVGRLVYYKGFEYLIRAMAHVPGRLLLVGEGPLKGELERLAAECGVADRVAFAGNAPEKELRALYRAAEIFVLASTERSEAFGIVQAEAMAAGTPVVNTRLASGVPFVSRDGETGLSVPPGDSEALAAALRRLLDDAGLRSRYGAAARRRAENVFSPEMMAASTLTLYRDAMDVPVWERADAGTREKIAV